MIKVRNVSVLPQDIGFGMQLEPGAEGLAAPDDPSVAAAIEGGSLLAISEPISESEPESEPEPKAPPKKRPAAKTNTKEDK